MASHKDHQIKCTDIIYQAVYTYYKHEYISNFPSIQQEMPKALSSKLPNTVSTNFWHMKPCKFGELLVVAKFYLPNFNDVL